MNCIALLGTKLGDCEIKTAGENEDGSIILGLRCGNCGKSIEIDVKQDTITPLLCKNCRKLSYIIPFAEDGQIYDLEAINRYKYKAYGAKAESKDKKEIYKYIISHQNED